MADPYLDEIDAALKATQQPAPAATNVPSGGLTPPLPALPPGQPDYGGEIAATLAAPPTAPLPPPETAGPPAPVAPYGFLRAGAHGMTLGLSDVSDAAFLASQRYFAGETPGFDFAEPYAEIKRGREAYAAGSPVASLGANVAGSLSGGPGSLAAKAITATPTWLGKLATSTATGSLLGGVQGAADEATSVPEAVQGGTTGAKVGAAIGAAVPAVSTVGSWMFPELPQAAQTLRAAGVNPPMGSALGGIPGVAENVFSHIPVIGAPIKAAGAGAREQLQTALTTQADSFNRDAVNQPLAKIGETLNPNTATGFDAIAEMQTKLSNAYKQAVPTAGGVIDGQASTAINDALANSKLNLAPSEATEFDKFVQNRIIGKAQQGTAGTATLSGPDFQDIDRALGKNAHDFLGSDNPYYQRLGESYLDLQGKMRDWLQRVSPQNAADLQAANEAWRMAKPVELAAYRSNDPNGIFTTAQLRSGARSASSTPQFAAGGALMQQFANNAEMQRGTLAEAGKKILAPSGGHAADIAGGAASGAAVTATLFENPELLRSPWLLGSAAVGYPLMKGLYSNPMRRGITGLLGQLGKLPPTVAPYGPVGAQVIPGLLNQNQQSQP